MAETRPVGVFLGDLGITDSAKEFSDVGLSHIEMQRVIHHLHISINVILRPEVIALSELWITDLGSVKCCSVIGQL